ncbi:hypothetical protein KAH37_08110 [bacterium]|nr:hypothetical protein [bacterium]
MGLFKKIIVAVSDKAKDELKEYVKRVLEEKEIAEKKDEEVVLAKPQPQEEPVEKAPIVEKTKQPEQEETQNSIAKMVPLVKELPQKYTFTTLTAPLTRDIIDLTQLLAFDEFTVYLKLYIYSVSQRKNYGYLGNSLRRKTGLDTMDHRLFELTLLKLSAHGLISIEDLSSNQRTFILYLPFDEDFMKSQKKKEAPHHTAPQKQGGNRDNRENRERNNSNRNTGNRTSRQRPPREKEDKKESHQNNNSQKQSSQKPAPQKQAPQKDVKPTKKTKSEPKKQTQQRAIPGRPTGAMSDDELRKQYVTFVSLEIDKAKMRVGRSSFDKIYMEAVKYIDSKYGFKVLSDPDKFKEYLTNYYMSAFDIPEFEDWKENKK